MADDDPMKALGALARDQDTMELEPELVRPFDSAELEALVRGVTARVHPLPKARPLWTRPALGAGAALFAAAAALLIFAKGRPPAGALPTFDLTVEGAARTTRGGSEPLSAVLRLHRDGSGVTLMVRPRVPTSAARASTWVGGQSGLTRWNVPIEQSSEGAFRIEVDGVALASLPLGSMRLLVVLGTDATVPRTPEAAENAAAGRLDGVQTLKQDIDLVP